MADFTNLLNPYANQWVVLAPRRARRPNQAKGHVSLCPFCPENVKNEGELYRVPIDGREESKEKEEREANSDWLIRVIPNKFPFADIHEVIILTPEHGGGFDVWTIEHTTAILQTYRQRFQTHRERGLVYIFHNSGSKAGESIEHHHSQLVVIPPDVTPQIPKISYLDAEETLDTLHFQIFCPKTSQWPDEVWVKAKREGVFGDTSDEELADLAVVLKKLIHIFDLRHGHDFPYNFYIYPGTSWYVRIIPRRKTIGGYEVGTGIFVNTQDPRETFRFISDHFTDPNLLSISLQHKVDYHHAV